MADLTSTLEALEHQWMRAWIEQDTKALKAQTARNFRFVLGAERPVLLDRTSLIEAPSQGFACKGYRFGKIYVRKHGRIAIFATPAEIDMKLDHEVWKGQFWMQDLWTKPRGRGWRLLERNLARLEEDVAVAKALHALQLWH